MAVAAVLASKTTRLESFERLFVLEEDDLGVGLSTDLSAHDGLCHLGPSDALASLLHLGISMRCAKDESALINPGKIASA
jgi:hypothetical protein